jgi:hypothetical protein
LYFSSFESKDSTIKDKYHNLSFCCCIPLVRVVKILGFFVSDKSRSIYHIAVSLSFFQFTISICFVISFIIITSFVFSNILLFINAKFESKINQSSTGFSLEDNSFINLLISPNICTFSF